MKQFRMPAQLGLLAFWVLATGGPPAIAGDCVAHESAAGGLVADCSDDSRRSIRVPGQVTPADDQNDRELRKKVRRLDVTEEQRAGNESHHGRLEFKHDASDGTRR